MYYHSFHLRLYRAIQEHTGVEPASALLVHSVGILPVEVTCQAAEAATPDSDRVLLEPPRRNGRRSLALEALFSKRINSKRNLHTNFHVRYLFAGHTFSFDDFCITFICLIKQNIL